VLAQDLLRRLAGAQVVADGLHSDAEASHNGLAVADVGVDGDAIDFGLSYRTYSTILPLL
jgi:hypothetical protein